MQESMIVGGGVVSAAVAGYEEETAIWNLLRNPIGLVVVVMDPGGGEIPIMMRFGIRENRYSRRGILLKRWRLVVARLVS